MIKIASKLPIVFRDRIDAGKQLLNYIKKEIPANDLKKDTCIIVALPRGGVPVAYEISKGLQTILDITCPRKIGAQGHSEYAIGAIAEHGEAFLNNEILTYTHSSPTYVQQEIAKQKIESQRRNQVYKKNRKPVSYQDKIVIIVDDGIATGSTMKAAINSIVSYNPKKIILAIPTAPIDSLQEILSSCSKVDEILCISTPEPFNAVGCFYDLFDQTDDETVINLLEKSLN